MGLSGLGAMGSAVSSQPCYSRLGLAPCVVQPPQCLPEGFAHHRKIRAGLGAPGPACQRHCPPWPDPRGQKRGGDLGRAQRPGFSVAYTPCSCGFVISATQWKRRRCRPPMNHEQSSATTQGSHLQVLRGESKVPMGEAGRGTGCCVIPCPRCPGLAGPRDRPEWWLGLGSPAAP